MKTKNLFEKVTDLTLYTGSNGQYRCTCKCPGCSQKEYGINHKEYQGNIEQIKKIMKYLPNLRNVYILGNPDTSVDTKFCNEVAKEFVKKDINVMFSTSGYNAVKTVKELTEGVSLDRIKYISFSVDSIKEDVIKVLKGSEHISLEQIGKAIEYCNQNKIPVKIQPTLWQINQDDYKEIIEYFYNMYNINWFTFHLASFEGIHGKENDILKNIEPEKWVNIRKDIVEIANKKELKILIPKIFLTDEEYKNYRPENSYCYLGSTGLQIRLEKDKIKCTVCPIHTGIEESFSFELEDEETKLEKVMSDCICATSCISRRLKATSIDKRGYEFKENGKLYHNVCRYYADRINY